MIRINCIQYLISPLIPHFPGKVLGKTDYFLNFPVNFPGKHKIFNFPGKFPGKSKKCVQRSHLIKIFIFFRKIYRKIQKIIGFPENFPGKWGINGEIKC